MQAKLLSQKEGIGIQGQISIRTFAKGTLEKVRKLIDLGQKEEADAILATGRLDVVCKNMIMTGTNIGRDLIVQRLLGVNTYSLNLNWGEIGTGTTPATLTDTALQTPVARSSAPVVQDIGNNQAQLQYFYPDNTLTNSVYTEFGTFVDGSASLGSGKLFNHALFVTPYTKAAGTDITVQVNITIS